jgi:hypothetical protein
MDTSRREQIPDREKLFVAVRVASPDAEKEMAAKGSWRDDENESWAAWIYFDNERIRSFSIRVKTLFNTFLLSCPPQLHGLLPVNAADTQSNARQEGQLAAPVNIKAAWAILADITRYPEFAPASSPDSGTARPDHNQAVSNAISRHHPGGRKTTRCRAGGNEYSLSQRAIEGCSRGVEHSTWKAAPIKLPHAYGLDEDPLPAATGGGSDNRTAGAHPGRCVFS